MAEENRIFKISKIKEEIDQVKAVIEKAERDYDLSTLSELKYGSPLQLSANWSL